MWINDLSISRKMTLAFSLILISLASSSGILYSALRDRDDWSAQKDTAAAQEVATFAAVAAHVDMAHTMRGYILTGVERHKRLYAEAGDLFSDSIKAATTGSGANANLKTTDALRKMQAASKEWRDRIGDPIIKLTDNPATRDQAVTLATSALSSELQQKFREAKDAAVAAVKAWEKNTEVGEADARRLADHSLMFGGLAAFLIALLASTLLSRNVAKPLRQLTEQMAHLARGDTRIQFVGLERKDCIGRMAQACETFKRGIMDKTRLEGETELQQRVANDERQKNDFEREREAEQLNKALTAFAAALGRLAKGDVVYRIDSPLEGPAENLRLDYNMTMQQLQETLLTVIQAADTIDAGSKEITATADDMSRRTEQQAANLEETAAALEQITETVKRTAQGASHARDAVSTATLDAEKGGTIVRQAIHAMDTIEKSSGQIGQIIGVIDEIAFQTNLLALNAGVEAARAGEAGRGFAVVASEVRALAQRSAEAAKEIKTLISASTAQVNQGVQLVSETGTALDRIVSQVAGIKQIVTEIASGAHEQATGLQEINNAINQMDQITQQNAAMVEESTASSYTLANEAQKLNSYVARFQVGSRAELPAARPVAAVERPRSTLPAPAARRKVANGGYEMPAKGSDPDSWEEF